VADAGQAVQRELAALLGAIASALPLLETRPAPLDDSSMEGAALDRLDTLLRAGDFESSAAFRELAGLMRRRWGSAVAELERHMRMFDHEGARVALQALRDGDGS
jgi:transposase